MKTLYTNIHLANTTCHGFITPFPWDILLALIIIIFIIGATIWLMENRDSTKVGLNSISKLYEKSDKDNREDMDIQHVVLDYGTKIMNHDVNQVRTPTRRSYFIYNNRDPSGETIRNMLQSLHATSASVIINGSMWRGYELAQLSPGNAPGDRYIVINYAWAIPARGRFRILTNNVPIYAPGNTWSIATTNPSVLSVEDDRNRDSRLGINFLNNN